MAAARDQAGNRTATEVARIMEREVLPYIGDGDLASIRKRDIIEIIDRVADRGATVRANRVLAWMRRFLNWCAARDLIDANPAQFVEKPSRETRRERVLDDGEIDLIWRALDASPQPFRDGLRLLILTAAMRDEIFGARWSELDEAGRCRDATLVYLSVGEGPVVAEQAGAMLLGQAPDDELIRAAAHTAATVDIEPTADIHASVAYRRFLAETLGRRVLRAAFARAGAEI